MKRLLPLLIIIMCIFSSLLQAGNEKVSDKRNEQDKEYTYDFFNPTVILDQKRRVLFFKTDHKELRKAGIELIKRYCDYLDGPKEEIKNKPFKDSEDPNNIFNPKECILITGENIEKLELPRAINKLAPTFLDIDRCSISIGLTGGLLHHTWIVIFPEQLNFYGQIKIMDGLCYTEESDGEINPMVLKKHIASLCPHDCNDIKTYIDPCDLEQLNRARVQLLYKTNHQKLYNACCKLILNKRTYKNMLEKRQSLRGGASKEKDQQLFTHEECLDPNMIQLNYKEIWKIKKIPKIFKDIHPERIRIFDKKLTMEMFRNNYSIRISAYLNINEGQGDIKLTDGMWYEDMGFVMVSDFDKYLKTLSP